MSKKVAEVVVSSILEKLEAGTVPWHKPWTVTRTNTMSYHGRSYRGINLLLTLISGRPGPWITRNQVRKQGGRIKDDQYKKGLAVILWKWIKKKDKATGEEKTFPITRFYNVWSLEQTEGVPKPGWLKKLEAEEEASKDRNDPIEAAQKVWDNYPEKPGLEFGFTHACYIPRKDKIEMPDLDRFTGSHEYYATLFHEMGHSTGHESRLNRKECGGTWFGSLDYSREELVAEFTSAILMAETGIDYTRTLDNAAAYIAHWSKAIKDDPKVFITAAQQGQKAVDHILDRKPEYKEKDEDNPQES
jgi:antirestriction protein ArdC